MCGGFVLEPDFCYASVKQEPGESKMRKCNFLPGDVVTKVKQMNSQSDLICRPIIPHNQILCLHHFNLRSLYFQSLQSLPNWIPLHTSGISRICTRFQLINNKNTFFCYSLLLGQFQLKLFYCGKGRQNFASNVTLYPCQRSRQNHLTHEVLKYCMAFIRTTYCTLLFCSNIAYWNKHSRKIFQFVP